MKIIGTEIELNWIENELPKLEDCALNTECALTNIPDSMRQAMAVDEVRKVCKKCIEENVVFEVEERKESL